MSEDGRNEQSSTSVGRGGIDPMLNAKLTRRKVQQDVELMGNRIERLRAEERKAKRVVPVAGDEGVLPQCRVGRTAHRCRRLARNDDDATTRFATTGEERRNVNAQN